MRKEEKINTPRKPRGPGAKMAPGEKPKDFKQAIKRLFKELKGYKVLITLSLILAIVSAIFSIVAPNRLSKLTDTISEGLAINSRNLEELTSKMQENLKTNIQKVVYIDEANVGKIMFDSSLSNSDKELLTNTFKDLNIPNEEKIKNVFTLPENILRVLFSDSTHDGVLVTVDDKINLIKLMESADISNVNIASDVLKVLFNEIEISGVKVSKDSQYELIKIMTNLENKDNISYIYSKLNELPDDIKEVIKPQMDMNKVKSIALFLSILYLFSAVFNYIQSINMTNVSNKFAKRLRSNISIKINKLPLSYFDRNEKGDILSRVTNDVDTIAMSMNNSLATLVTSITLFAGTTFMMFYTNWIMALTAVGASVIGFLGMGLILKNSQKYFTLRQEELGNLNGHIEEIYSGLNVVKAYNGKYESDKEFDTINKKLSKYNQKSQFLSGIMQPIMGFIGNFGYVCVCIVGAILTMNDMITFGVIVAFMTYVRLFTSPLSQIAQAMTSLQTTAAASERVFEFIDEKEMLNEDSIKTKLDKNKVKGKIEFENVVFKYEDSKKPTIKGFTATALPGQKIAIVGPTGAGKTTMVNLLMKFYNIDSGDIKIDGVSTSKLTRENIHELFTMVLQDTWLFEGTVKENIIYNRDNITDEQVKEVCKKIGLHHFIKTLPNGYDSKISESDSISSGQRQLLTIARGMIEDAPFLILDEATSNVDTRTEELVQNAMDKLAENRTSFIIAHRLSTIKNADLILVMNHGNIIEHGNHDELMAKNGFYAELYNSQFKL